MLKAFFKIFLKTIIISTLLLITIYLFDEFIIYKCGIACRINEFIICKRCGIIINSDYIEILGIKFNEIDNYKTTKYNDSFLKYFKNCKIHNNRMLLGYGCNISYFNNVYPNVNIPPMPDYYDVKLTKLTEFILNNFDNNYNKKFHALIFNEYINRNKSYRSNFENDFSSLEKTSYGKSNNSYDTVFTIVTVKEYINKYEQTHDLNSIIKFLEL